MKSPSYFLFERILPENELLAYAPAGAPDLENPDSYAESDLLAFLDGSPAKWPEFLRLAELASGGRRFARVYCGEFDEAENSLPEAEADALWAEAEAAGLAFHLENPSLGGDESLGGLGFGYVVGAYLPGRFLAFGWGCSAASAIVTYYAF